MLLVGSEASIRPGIVKSLGKVFPSNFVFEVKSLDEATDLLKKLHIDVLMIDLDKEKMDFQAMDKRFPNTMFVGLSHNPRLIDVPMNAFKHRMFSKNDLLPTFQAELRSLKRGAGLPEDRARKEKIAEPADSDEFLDFRILVEKQPLTSAKR